MSTQPSRRDFLGSTAKTAGFVGAGLTLTRRSTWAQSEGSNGDIRIAILGVGGKGSAHIDDFGNVPGVRIVAVADADLTHVERAKGRFTDNSRQVDGYQDYRHVLDRSDVDAVVIATPNHWHTPMAVHACQAGKDVYVEKPVTHNIAEGKALAEAAKKYERIVQAGMQRRSDPGWIEAMEFLRSGELGPVKVSRGLCYKRRKSIGKVNGPQSVPDHIDYNLWSGPAQLEPVLREQFHYDWHWFWAYGNGDLGNQGVHQTDIARWAIGAEKLPQRVLSVGGRFGYNDDGESPNTQFALFEYPEGLVIFEVRGLGMKAGMENRPVYKVSSDHPAGVDVGNVIHCENGYIAEAGAYDNSGKRIRKFGFTGGGEHQTHFINAVRSRKQSDIFGDAAAGHLSAAICHLANLSHRLGRWTKPETVSERLQGNDAALATYESFKEHLVANNVDLHDFRPVLGAALEIDPEQEIFTGEGSDEANKLLSRDYRSPFDIAKI